MASHYRDKGISFPMKVSAKGPSKGKISTSSQEQKIRESILIILGTQHGERLMRPDFGCNLRSLAFAPNNAATANLARHYVETGLRKWEPRIILDDVVVTNDNLNGCLIINIFYKIRSTYESQEILGYSFDLLS